MNFFPSSVPPPQLNIGQTQGASGVMGAIPGVQQYAGMGSSYMPYANMAFNQGFNNPFAGQALGGAQTGATYGDPTVANMWNTGQNFIGAGTSMLPYAYNVMNQGFDPQGALYSRTAQQLQDQTRAAEAARGIGTTPYGAGVEADQMRNFNIDWQNNQLQRQIASGQAGAGMIGAGAGVAGQGLGWQAGIPSWMAQTAALPYATYNAINSGQWQQLQNMLSYGAGGQGLAQAPVQDWLGLYGAGNQQQANAANIYRTQTGATQDTFKDLAQLGGGLGSLASAGAKYLPMLLA